MKMNKLKELRTKNKISQQDLAKIVNVKQNIISNWEYEKTEIDQKNLLILADYFNVSIDYLLGRNKNYSLPPIKKQLINYYESCNEKSQLKTLIKKAQGNRTQNQFALNCDISSAALTRYIKGDRFPTPESLKKIASNAYNGVTYEELMESAGYIKSSKKVNNIEQKQKYNNNQKKLIDYYNSCNEKSQEMILWYAKCIAEKDKDDFYK